MTALRDSGLVSALQSSPGGGEGDTRLDGNNIFTEVNLFEQGIAFGSISTPPPLGTQYTLFVYGGELYWRLLDDNLAAGWSTALQDDTKKFLQASTAGDDVEDLQDGGDPAFDTYWSTTGVGTVDRVNDKFVVSGLPLSAITQELLFDNDVEGYIFDPADTPMVFNIPVEIPSIGSLQAGASEILQLSSTISGGSVLSLKIVRLLDGTIDKMQIVVSRATALAYKIFTIPPESYLERDTEVVLIWQLEALAWSLTSDGIPVADSDDVPETEFGSSTGNLELYDAFETWTATKGSVAVATSITDAPASVSELKIGDITITPTF